MLELIPPGLNFDFVSKAKFFITASLLIIVLGVMSLIVRGGFNEGIDFSGGTLVQLRLSQPADLRVIRETLATLGIDTAIVQHYGDEREVLIRVAQHAAAGQDIGKQVQHTLQDRLGGQPIELRRVEIVGPQASADLRQKALFALFYATLGIVAYISGRFEGKWVIAVSLATLLFAVTYSLIQWLPGISPAVLIIVALLVSTVFNMLLQLRFALAALVAIYHDVLITASFLSFWHIEFDLQIVVALLTITGYSLYDTIVVFDRIRENMGRQRQEHFPALVNASINQTLSRTVLTSGHTMLVLLALYCFGGKGLHGFAFALLIGILSGTYSTIFIASPILIYWQRLTAKLQAGTFVLGLVRSHRASESSQCSPVQRE